MQHRLAAILAADVAGYTRLVEKDTAGTVANWRKARTYVIEPTVEKHGGHLVKLTGDGFLVEFLTVRQAVCRALALQLELTREPLQFRIGVSMGDIVDDGDDIHGEGVNIAARIEALADPGSVCVSGMVHDTVHHQLNAVFEDIGTHRVKHVSDPVRVWRWVVPESGAGGRPLSPVGDPAKSGDEVLALPQKPSIAVLPFDSMSSDPEVGAPQPG